MWWCEVWWCESCGGVRCGGVRCGGVRGVCKEKWKHLMHIHVGVHLYGFNLI